MRDVRTPFLIEGIVPALVTPFHDDESLDLDALERVIERVVSAGVHGVFVAGSQGEFWALTTSEQREVIAAAVAAVGGRVPVYAGVTALSTREAVERAVAAQAAGADALTLLPPFFVAPSERELAEHFRVVAGAVSLPIVLYNHPAKTGRPLSVPLVAELAEDPQFVAVKDSSASINSTSAYVTGMPDGFSVLSGNDAQIAWALLAGADGAIASTANVAPELCVAIYDAVRASDIERARALQASLARLRAAFDFGTFPVVVKEALALVGEPVGPCRAPVGPLDATTRERLRALLDEVRQTEPTTPAPPARSASA